MLVRRIKEVKEILKEKRSSGLSIGFVPTMGYLHEGHVSLIKIAKEKNEIVVVSVFVNPTQFSPDEDYENYPRNIERDYALALQGGADIVFYPIESEIYPDGASTYVEVEGSLASKLCGHSRPIHFRGVTTVVSKLFHIIAPDDAYFGQKDAQQCIIVKKMVRDLHIDVNVVVCPIIREDDGLAMSSRNVYLTEDERNQAVSLYSSLIKGKEAFYSGIREVKKIRDIMKTIIQENPLAEIEYIEVLDATNLDEIDEIRENAIAFVAVRFGNTRLIDNMILEKEGKPCI